jgi:predicted RNA-binding Zn ribbon-like protein
LDADKAGKLQEVTRFVWLAGHLGLDLVNTEIVDGGERKDLLETPQDLAAWLGEAAARYGNEASRGAVRVREKDLAAARELRAAIRAAADAMAASKPVPHKSMGAINGVLRSAGKVAQIEGAHGKYKLAWRFEVEAPEALLASVAEAAARLLTEADPRRVHKCGSPDCILYIYDATKSRTRQWCDMKTCGNRMKAAKFYQRHRTSARGKR